MNKRDLLRGLAKERALVQLLELGPEEIRKRAATDAPPNSPALAEVETFCLFIGYPRSGHSLVGSLLDAHPDIVIAHELDALRYLKAGLSAAEIYPLLLESARLHAELDRRWGDYTYVVPNQWQGRFRRLAVIGDKKGGSTTWQLEHDPALLDCLMTRITHRKRFIHVLRNPFDNIATMSLKPTFEDGKGQVSRQLRRLRRFFSRRSVMHAAMHYFELHAANRRLIERIGAENVRTLYYEDFVADPRRMLSDLVAWLGRTADPGYLDDCAAVVFPEPRRSRDRIRWPAALLAEIEARIGEAPLLARYNFTT